MLKTYLQAAYYIWTRFYDNTLDPWFAFDRKSVVRELGNAKNVLELGIGTGLNLPYYRKGTRVTGVDFSHMIEAAKDKKTSAKVTLQRADARTLAFPPGLFDAALATFVLRVTPEPKEVLREASRVVKKDGLLVVVDMFREDASVWQRLATPFTVLLGWGRNHSYERLIENTSWRVERTKPLHEAVRLLVLRNA